MMQHEFSKDMTLGRHQSSFDNFKHQINDSAMRSRSWIREAPHISHDLDMFIPIAGRWKIATASKHWIGGVPAQLNPATWIRELQYCEDSELKQFLIDGVLNGFPIVDKNCTISPYECVNYKSATEGPASEFISKLMVKELAECKLIQAEEYPHCIHSIGAVPKKE